MLPTEQARTSRPLTSRIQKSMLPALTSDFPEFFWRLESATETEANALFCRNLLRSQLLSRHGTRRAGAGSYFICDLDRLAVVRFQLRDVDALFEMEPYRLTRQYTHLRERMRAARDFLHLRGQFAGHGRGRLVHPAAR